MKGLETMQIKTIAIILCDNDFGGVFTNLLKTILSAIKYNPELKEREIEKAIHEGAIVFYCLFQWSANDENYDRIKRYFKQNIKILFNEDAINAALTLDHDGGSWYLDVENEQINAF